jgi:hypothetical protein
MTMRKLKSAKVTSLSFPYLFLTSYVLLSSSFSSTVSLLLAFGFDPSFSSKSMKFSARLSNSSRLSSRRLTSDYLSPILGFTSSPIPYPFYLTTKMESIFTNSKSLGSISISSTTVDAIVSLFLASSTSLWVCISSLTSLYLLYGSQS